MNKLREFTAEHDFYDIEFLQNNSFMYEDVAICGTRGWINPVGIISAVRTEKYSIGKF